MTKYLSVFASSLVVASMALAGNTAPLHDPADYPKNILDVQFRSLPDDITTLPKTEPQNWDFGFRPYGSADMLWTDPILQRDVTAGALVEGTPTALNVSCNENGFTILVLCVDPAIAKAYSNSNNVPGPSLEFFFTPGDFDTPSIEHYYQLIMGAYGHKDFMEFPWLVKTRDFRPVLEYVSGDSTFVDSAVIARINVPWTPLFDRLPLFQEKRDNFWRLSMIRWNGTGQTWGGTVHKASQAGYIRWPEFTKEQRTAIMANVLRQGWQDFNRTIGLREFTTASGWGGVSPTVAPFRTDELKANPRSFLLYNEDLDFRPTLEKLVNERKALGPALASFESLPKAEQDAFYKKASDMLFNFRYDVEEAYAEFEKAKLFK